MNFPFILVLVLAACYVLIVESIFIEIDHHSKRCLGQNLDHEDLAVFVVSSPSSSTLKNDETKKKQVSVEILDPSGSEIKSETIPYPLIQPSVFTYNVETNGVHKVCVTTLAEDEDLDAFLVSVNIDFKSRSGKLGKTKTSKQISKEDLPTLGDKLRCVEETLSDISKEIDFARRQELLLKEAGENTQWRIRWFQIFSISVLIITAVWQLVYWRRFFKSKKLL